MGTSEDAVWPEWAKVVKDYTRRGLAEPSDKLPALSGIATRFQKATNDVYCAGLWKSSLLKELEWISTQPPHHCRPSIYRAPTWSWASVSSGTAWVEYKQPDEDSAATYTVIVDCRVTLEDTSARFGKVREGALTIRGVSKTLKWNGSAHIPPADVDPAMIPIPVKRNPRQFLPDGIVAFALPDLARESCHVKSNLVNQNLDEVMFYMGAHQKGVNEIRRLVFLVVIDGNSALMLVKVGERTFTRLGLVRFEDEEKLEQYFDGCEEKTFTIY